MARCQLGIPVGGMAGKTSQRPHRKGRLQSTAGGNRRLAWDLVLQQLAERNEQKSRGCVNEVRREEEKDKRVLEPQDARVR